MNIFGKIQNGEHFTFVSVNIRRKIIKANILIYFYKVYNF